jgi:hypothetical protein
MKGFCLYTVFFFSLTGPVALAQTPQPADAPASNSSSSAATAKTPAATADNKPADGKKPKRVWTNDEVGSLKGSVSVVGDNESGGKGATKDPLPDTRESDGHADKVRRCREAIEQLRSQIAQADARIAQLKNFKGENVSPSGGINPHQGYNMVPPEEQVKQLEERKKQCQAKIDDLENQARKEGIDPGELR